MLSLRGRGGTVKHSIWTRSLPAPACKTRPTHGHQAKESLESPPHSHPAGKGLPPLLLPARTRDELSTPGGQRTGHRPWSLVHRPWPHPRPAHSWSQINTWLLTKLYGLSKRLTLGGGTDLIGKVTGTVDCPGAEAFSAKPRKVPDSSYASVILCLGAAIVTKVTRDCSSVEGYGTVFNTPSISTHPKFTTKTSYLLHHQRKRLRRKRGNFMV